MKKIIWIIIILIVVSVGVLGTYWYFDKEQRGTDGGSLSIGDFFPFGRDAETLIDNAGNVPTQTIDTSTPAPTARLWKIANNHQAGAGLFDREGETFVRFIDTATGNVFENKIGEFGLKRISNTTIPKIKEAMWLPTGDSVIARYSNDSGTIQTLHAKISPPKTLAEISAENPESIGEIEQELQELKGTLLPSNIVGLAVFAPKDKAFYLVKNNNGVIGYTSSADGVKPLKIFDSPLSEWNISWPKENTIVLTTKPSAFSLGYSYLVNSTSGSIQRLMGNVPGLSVKPSPDLKKVLYSETSSNGSDINLKIFDVETGGVATVVRTLAEKCLWQKDNITALCAVPNTLPSGNYPDSWYEGSVSFSDNIWSINTSSGELKKLVDVKDIGGEDIDAINLSTDANENFLIFTNKKDSTLWAFRLNEVGNE